MANNRITAQQNQLSKLNCDKEVVSEEECLVQHGGELVIFMLLLWEIYEVDYPIQICLLSGFIVWITSWFRDLQNKSEPLTSCTLYHNHSNTHSYMHWLPIKPVYPLFVRLLYMEYIESWIPLMSHLEGLSSIDDKNSGLYYRQIFNIRRTKFPNLNVGAAPTTAQWWTILLPTKVWLILES